MIGILSALASAFVWGSGDFVGGRATRRVPQFQVVALTSLSGLLILFLAAVLRREPFPAPTTIGWACAAGLSGAVGVAALYQGLSAGSAAVIAPTSGVVAAIVPVVAGSFMQGLPAGMQVGGILLGLAGIYLVSQPPPNATNTRVHGWRELALALFAGIGFGGFFVLIAQVESDLIFGPLAFAKLAAFALSILILFITRRSAALFALDPLALFAGVLDAGGNLFYLIAVQYVSLAVAGVVASMYPASTVVLSMILLGQKIVRTQAIGVCLCLGAVALITL